MILETYTNRPGKTLASVILLLLGAYTFFFHQEVQVESIESFISIVTEASNDMKKILMTWGLNLLCAMGYVLLGAGWLKDVFIYNYLDNYPDQSRFICFLMSMLCFGISWVFISFIFTKLIGIVIVTVLSAIVIYGNSDDRRR
ncbi:hypothetical protein [Bacillus sp. S/N-304-OC-R1]|uniref:hypothetical protein n=1 Tax=Bacillus sp. S/N-304-OC-R1 TaxID=2758034 RepID=UPI001C8E735C|nr:hypothetical protein [Bacillus sp. S/N-304-OC-R1]MBY0122130.1 hypothetical protein [Bacillus sp. S/N-304-OC-R1]